MAFKDYQLFITLSTKELIHFASNLNIFIHKTNYSLLHSHQKKCSLSSFIIKYIIIF
jgi:hypothetical protein